MCEWICTYIHVLYVYIDQTLRLSSLSLLTLVCYRCLCGIAARTFAFSLFYIGFLVVHVHTCVHLVFRFIFSVQCAIEEAYHAVWPVHMYIFKCNIYYGFSMVTMLALLDNVHKMLICGAGSCGMPHKSV
jgi:hypothetical protein